MAVKVLITRRFQEGKGMEVLSLLNKLRSEAMNQPGYITGETVVGYDDPQKLLVIGTWDEVDHWIKWRDNPDRKATESKIAHFLIDPTEYEVFVFGSFPKPKAAR